jgi:soluble lytic murein transglycosylase-like protein
MANKNYLQLRSQRLALRFFMICLIQSVVVTYLVLDLTDNRKSVAFLSVQSTPLVDQASIGDALASLWTGRTERQGVQFASLASYHRPSDTMQEERRTQMKRQMLVERIIGDFQVGFDKNEVGQMAQVIDSESRRYSYDPRLLLAVILTESSLRKGNISYQGAHGLMQIKPIVAAELANRPGHDFEGKTSLFDPAYNIKLGSLYLFELILKYGDIRNGLIAYNLGETAMRDRLATNRKLPSQYVHKVMSTYEELLEKYPDA